MHSGAHTTTGASVALLLALVAVLVLYLHAAVRPHPHRACWNRWRSISFGIGVTLLAAAISPPVAHYAHHSLEGHMLQHLLLGMFAPLFLVLGAPGTLLLRSVPVMAARKLVALLDTRAVRFLIHPLAALVFDMGGMALLYLTPLYALSTQVPALHVFIHVHFLVSGVLFTWAVAGPDAAPHRPGWPVRLLALFLGTAVHAILGKWMYAYGYPRITFHPVEDIQAAAKLMYYGGDLAELLLIFALFDAWRRAGSRRLPPTGTGLPAEPAPERWQDSHARQRKPFSTRAQSSINAPSAVISALRMRRPANSGAKARR